MLPFKTLRTFVTILSLYFLYKGLQLSSMKAALPYLLPGVFWGAYYYHFVREILNKQRVPLGERIWYILFMLIGITGIFTGAALSSTGTQFLISIVVWVSILVIFVRAEGRIKNAVNTLRTYSDILLPAIFVATGALICLVFPIPLNLAYLLTFIAIGGTIYEWELEEEARRC